ncbi:MAG: trypsin-like peptidase domain-containing protein [Planctomycetes bacterium]|nr:trypsin-like peptidase domain-containing protein [Planctomycetota bacterium]
MKRWLISIVLVLAGFTAGSALWLQGQPNPQAVLPRELTSYRDVVKRVLPAVVSIETYAKPKSGAKNPQFFDDPNIPEPFRKPPGKSADPDRLGFGSGFLADAAGVVVTNYHVVEGAEVAVVLLHDGRKFSSKNIRVDRRTDVAIILLDAKDVRFPALEFGDSDAMEIGDRVLAVGAPFGLAGSVTQGIVSAKGRNGLNMSMYEDFLQTDAAINPGNSGGPLVNLEGKVVGINAAIKSKSGGFQGVGLAVASNLAKSVVPALREHGAVKRGYLGAHIRELDRDVADRLGAPKEGGVVVAEVFDKTPASKAGLKAGDIITTVAGRSVKDGNALQKVIAALPIDKAVDVDVIRAGKTERLTVVIEEQPAEYGVTPAAPAPRNIRPAPPGVAIDALGIDATELTDDLSDDLGHRKGAQGIVITRVHDAGLAAVAGLKVGAVISKIDATRITNPAAAQKALQAADLQRGIVLQVATVQGGVSYVLVKSLR